MSDKRYGVIVADPPWRYANTAVQGNVDAQYPTLSVDEICALPVRELAADDSVLLLWVTWPQLREGLRVVEAWGFEYVTGFPWVKIIGHPSQNLWGEIEVRSQYGVGFWIRGCTEALLIARRGHVSPPSGAGLVGLLSPNLHHSRKPENIYHLAEQLPGPYVELFARRARRGWDNWGNEIETEVRLERE